MLAYDDWANAEALASLVVWKERLRRRAAPGDDASTRRRVHALRQARLLLAHVVATEFLWIARLAGERAPLPVWPTLALEECEARLAELARTWYEIVSAMRGHELARMVTYVNSKGEPWRSTAGDIVTHVVVHSAYHRGQIAALVRGGKAQPAPTDFIHCTRNGWIEPLAASRPATRTARVRRQR